MSLNRGKKTKVINQVIDELLSGDKPFNSSDVTALANKKVNVTSRMVVLVCAERKDEIEAFNDLLLAKETLISENGYQWSIRGKKMSFSIEEVDNLFYEYSEHGLNLTQTQIMNKHGFEPQEWHSIKSKLGLYKKSHIFSDWTLKNKSHEEIEKVTDQKISHALRDRLNIENQYTRVLNKEYKKTIRNSEIKEITKQSLLSAIDQTLSALSSEIKAPVPVRTKGVSGKIVVNTADWHLGAFVRGLDITLDFDLDILKQRLQHIANSINQMNPKEVVLVIAGDLIESFTGMNHKNSFMSIQQGLIGSTLIKTAVETIVWFISLINNVKRVYGVSGNHDRGSDDNNFDVTGWISDIIFYILSKIYLKNILVEYKSSVVNFDYDGINYIIRHGHKTAHRRKEYDTVLFTYGRKDMFNLIIQGHDHTRAIRSDAYRYRNIVLSPIFSGNQYSEDLGYSSLPGATITSNNGNGFPIVIDIPAI